MGELEESIINSDNEDNLIISDLDKNNIKFKTELNNKSKSDFLKDKLTNESKIKKEKMNYILVQKKL